VPHVSTVDQQLVSIALIWDVLEYTCITFSKANAVDMLTTTNWLQIRGYLGLITKSTRSSTRQIAVCGKHVRINGSIICFLDLQCHMVWVGKLCAHNNVPNSWHEFLVISVAHSIYHTQCSIHRIIPWGRSKFRQPYMVGCQRAIQKGFMLHNNLHYRNKSRDLQIPHVASSFTWNIRSLLLLSSQQDLTCTKFDTTILCIALLHKHSYKR
jgi:hypothetical protein